MCTDIPLKCLTQLPSRLQNSILPMVHLCMFNCNTFPVAVWFHVNIHRFFVDRVQLSAIGSKNSFIRWEWYWSYWLGLFLYDWAIMLPVEISEIWMQRITLVTLIYFLMRYFFVFGSIAAIAFTFPAGDAEVFYLIIWYFDWSHSFSVVSIFGSLLIPRFCNSIMQLRCHLLAYGYIPYNFGHSIQMYYIFSFLRFFCDFLAVVFTLRTWAIYQRNKLVLIILSVLALATVLSDLVGTGVSTLSSLCWWYGRASLGQRRLAISALMRPYLGVVVKKRVPHIKGDSAIAFRSFYWITPSPADVVQLLLCTVITLWSFYRDWCHDLF